MAGIPAHMMMIQLLVYKYCFSQNYTPPTILYPATREDLYYQEGTTLNITCLASGMPPPTFRWIINGSDIVPTGFISFNSVSGVLSFFQFSWKEEGAFRCIATNEFTDNSSGTLKLSSMSPILNLKQTTIKEFESGIKTLRAQEYQYVRLPCGHAKTLRAKKIKYEWHNTGTRLKVDMDDGRLFIDQKGDLHITYALTKDGFLDGYSCTIFVFITPVVHQLTRGSKIALTVDANSYTVTKPVIRYHDQVTALISSTAVLECLFSGYDILSPHFPTAKWADVLNHPYNTTTGKYNVTSSGRQLIIYKVDEEDQKSYFCYANNSAGQAVASVYLNVTSGPIFIQQPPNLTQAMLTKEHHFDCETRSAKGEINPGSPVWYINSKQLDRQTADTRFALANNNKTLIIKNVRGPQDFMCVQCDVSNSVDIASANTCLAAFFSPIIVARRPPLKQEIRYKDVVDLTVIASTNHSTPLRYRWKFRSKEIAGGNAPPFVTFNRVSMEAYIDTCHISKEEYPTIGGVYTIMVYSPYQTVEVNTNVVLMDVHEDGPDNEGYFSTMKISLLIIGAVLIVGLSLFACILWTRKRRRKAKRARHHTPPRSPEGEGKKSEKVSEVKSDSTLQTQSSVQYTVSTSVDPE